MSNITTDINSFENIDYPKNIYELLLQLKNQPLQINCNSTSNSNASGSYQKYNSEETLLRLDPVFGEIYTKTFILTDSYQIPPPDLSFEFQINDLHINNILDLSVILNVKKSHLFTTETENIIRYLTKIYDLNDFLNIKDRGSAIIIPITDIENDFSLIASQGIYQQTSLYTFITLVYTKIQP